MSSNCSICTGEINVFNPSSDFQTPQHSKTKHPNEPIHARCMGAWMQFKILMGEDPTCPICRYVFPLSLDQRKEIIRTEYRSWTQIFKDAPSYIRFAGKEALKTTAVCGFAGLLLNSKGVLSPNLAAGAVSTVSAGVFASGIFMTHLAQAFACRSLRIQQIACIFGFGLGSLAAQPALASINRYLAPTKQDLLAGSLAFLPAAIINLNRLRMLF